MIQAFSIIRNIYTLFLDFVFNKFQIATVEGEPVYFGWIAIVCIAITILLRNIVVVPANGEDSEEKDG